MMHLIKLVIQKNENTYLVMKLDSVTNYPLRQLIINFTKNYISSEVFY